MGTVIHFFVSGIPAPQGSKRHVGNGRMIESSKKLKPWRAEVKRVAELIAEIGEPLDCPLRVSMDFYLPRPKRSKFKDHPAGKPDADKLARAVNDALTDSGLIADDSRIVSLHVRKHWTDDTPGASITVEPLWERLHASLGR